jgi:PST family polysaccharide transporter
MPFWLRYMPVSLQAKLAHRHNFLAITHNSAWLFVDKIIRLCVGLFVGIWLTRYLGPEQTGIWSYALAFSGIFGAFCALGLDGIAVREIARNPDKTNDILGTTFCLKLVGAFIAVATSLTAIILMQSKDALTIWLVAISSFGFILQAFGVIDFYYQSRLKSKYTVLAANASFIFISILKVVFILNKAPLITFAWIGLTEIFISMMLLIVFYQRQNNNILNWHFSLNTAKLLLQNSWPIVVSAIAISIYMKIDQLLIGRLLGNEQLGFYAAALKLFEIILVIPSLIAQSLFPNLMRLQQIDFNHTLSKIYFYTIRISLLLTISIVLFSENIINLFYGENFSASAEVLSAMMLSLTFVSVGIINSIYILYYSRQKFITVVTILGAVLNLVLCYSLIRYFGLAGAVYSTVITYIFVNYLIFLFIPTLRPMFKLINKSFLQLKIPAL